MTDSIVKQNLYLFELEKTEWSKHWGEKQDEFSEPFSPSLKVCYFSKAKSVLDIKFSTEKGSLIKSVKDSAESGLNYMTYDLSIDQVSLKSLERSLSGKTQVHLNAAENKMYYLPKGKYKIEISDQQGNKVNSAFEITESESGGAPSGKPAAESEENDIK